MSSKFSFDITDQMEADALIHGVLRDGLPVTADMMAKDQLDARFADLARSANDIRAKQRDAKLAQIPDDSVKTKLMTDFEAAIDAELAKVAVVDDPAPAPSPAVVVQP